VPISDEDTRALAGERMRYSPTYTRTATGDERSLANYPIHEIKRLVVAAVP